MIDLWVISRKCASTARACTLILGVQEPLAGNTAARCLSATQTGHTELPTICIQTGNACWRKLPVAFTSRVEELLKHVSGPTRTLASHLRSSRTRAPPAQLRH